MMPNEVFFHPNPKLLGLGRQIGQINFGALGVFLADLLAPILGTVHYFFKKLKNRTCIGYANVIVIVLVLVSLTFVLLYPSVAYKAR